MKKFIKFLFAGVMVLVGLLMLLLGVLYFHSFDLPRSLVGRCCDAFSNSGSALSCGRVSFGFREGLTVRNVRYYDRNPDKPLKPVFAADAVFVHPLRRQVKVVGAWYPRLFDSYYAPGYTAPADPAAPCGDFRFPALGNFDLVLEHPAILGVTPQRVVAEVSCEPERLLFSQIRLDWPDLDHRMWLDGFCDVDLAKGSIRGEVKGTTVQAHIRPLLVALDVPSSYPYIDGFTEVPGPVGAYCGWDVALPKNEFRLKLDLHPPMGRYNGVAMARTDGQLDLLVQYGGRLDYHHRIGPISAVSPKGGTLDGTVLIDGTNGVVHLTFDAKSTLPFEDLFAIADVYRNGETDFLRFDEPPEGTIRGVLVPNPAQQADNDLHGRLSGAKLNVFGVPLRAATGDWSYVGDRLAFENLSARARDGGRVTGNVWSTFPGGERDKGRFGLDLNYDGGSLRELADVFGFDPGGRHGKVTGALTLTGPMASNGVSRLDGRGRMAVRDGHLAQMKLFANWTKQVADTIPGVETVINQSMASGSFAIADGILRTEDLSIEGKVFAILAEGSYDLAKDNLDFRVRMQFTNDESYLRYLVRPIVWPFSKLFMEYRLTGPIGNPTWHYVNVAQRIPWPEETLRKFGQALKSFVGLEEAAAAEDDR